MAVPKWLPKKYHKHWNKPWTSAARRSVGFRWHLGRHGLLTPHFSYREAGGQGRSPLGTALPRWMRPRARRHAFNLERLRHALGDRSISIGSWYRNPRHNSSVGGARFSRHMAGDATDIFKDEVNSHGADRFDRIASAIFADGGFGTYPSGSRHVDSRGFRARW